MKHKTTLLFRKELHMETANVVGMIVGFLIIIFVVIVTLGAISDTHATTKENNKLLLLIARRSFGVYTTPEVKELLQINGFDKKLIDKITAIKS